MPYSNVPEEDWDKMDRCVEEVMAKQPDLEKSNAVAICHESIVGKEASSKQHGGEHEGHGGAHGEGGSKPSPKRRDAREEFNTVNQRLAAGNLKSGEQASLEKRAERAAREILEIAPEDEGGAVQTLDEIEAMVRADMGKAGKEDSSKGFIAELIDNILAPFAEKAGARHSQTDSDALQLIHDKATELGAECPMMIFKEASGRLRWVTFSSSAYQDKDGEIVSLKAQEADCDALDESSDYGPLRWWHVGQPYTVKVGDYKSWVAGKGLDIGVCDFSGMHGRIRIESGTFHDDRIGVKVKEHADELSVSLGFSHPETEPEATGGVFEHTHTFERSLLPRGKQSNYFASVPVIEKESTMKDSKIERFKNLMGEFADLALNKAEATDKAAETAGVAFKEDEARKPFAFGSEAEAKAFVKECMNEMMADKAKESKEAKAEGDSATLKALGELQTTLKSLQANDEQIAEALNKIGAATKSNSGAIKSLQGDLPRSLKHLARSTAEDNVIDEATVKGNAPQQQKANDGSDFWNFAVTGDSRNAKTPTG